LAVIIAVALVLFINGRIAVDVTGLLVLSALALTGLVSTTEALAGFSSPAVITVIGMFILSAGLTRTGLAYRLGQPLQRLAKSRENVGIVALMFTAGALSALINTTTVAAIMLPAAMELSRRSGRPPSRLLMPMALGCLLGGPFTGISTPSNILATEALSSAGLSPFGLFDFTPITAVLLLAGTIFVVLVGKYLLPKSGERNNAERQGTPEAAYHLSTHLFTAQIRPDSKLVGRTLAESRLGSALYLTVVGLRRRGKLLLSPGPDEILREKDVLIVHGHEHHLRYLRGNHHLMAEESQDEAQRIFQELVVVGAVVPENSPLLSLNLEESNLRRKYRAHLLALRDAAEKTIQPHGRRPFAPGDRLFLQGRRQDLDRLVADGLVGPLCVLEADKAVPEHTMLLPMRVPDSSVLVDKNIAESRLGNALALTIIGIVRSGDFLFMPLAEEILRRDDLLILQGDKDDLEILEGLQELVLQAPSADLAAELESQQAGVTEVLLSPRTNLAERTLGDLLFREHYGLNVLAIWRKGSVLRTRLPSVPLQFGDALLVYGPRRNLEAVARDPDFLVLDRESTRTPLVKKAPLAAFIMAMVLLSAISGLVPIAIAALTGAAMMVLGGCLSMDQAYRAIEWKVIFLVASMLPLGIAVQNTGAAQIASEVLISTVGALGPRWVVAALFLVTAIGTQVIPTSALVVLMAPIALNAAQSLSISPHLLMMTIAIAAASSYASPLSHPAHLLIMGPGGYRFMDYVKIGVPLTILVMILSVWLLPVFWPV
jgi:di/tricarboxylate transporter